MEGLSETLFRNYESGIEGQLIIIRPLRVVRVQKSNLATALNIRFLSV
jgi:hypothetical protein